MKEITESEMLQKMASYCSVAERCLQDISKKLDATGLSEEAKENIKLRLVQEKFLDESERFYKLLRFAAGRGFTTQEAGSCLKKILMASTDIELDYDEDME